jgi:hypothetical protein
VPVYTAAIDRQRTVNQTPFFLAMFKATAGDIIKGSVLPVEESKLTA